MKFLATFHILPLDSLRLHSSFTLPSVFVVLERSRRGQSAKASSLRYGLGSWRHYATIKHFNLDSEGMPDTTDGDSPYLTLPVSVAICPWVAQKSTRAKVSKSLDSPSISSQVPIMALVVNFHLIAS